MNNEVIYEEVPFHPDYQRLRGVLFQALSQALSGKGAERHAKGEPFERQRMQTISHLLGTERGMAFQAVKKLTEGLDLPTHEMRVKELLGAINYIAGIIVFLEDGSEKTAEEPPQSESPCDHVFGLGS